MPDSLLTQLQNATGSPPEHLTSEQQVLWFTKADNWQNAHDIAENLPDPNGAWLHAHLHRVEGDLWNADYWYQRAQQPSPPKDLSLEDEWLLLAKHFCQ